MFDSSFTQYIFAFVTIEGVSDHKSAQSQEKRQEAEEKGEDVFGSSFMKDRAYIDDDDDGIQYPGSEA